MSDHAPPVDDDRTVSHPAAPGEATIETYRTDGGVVFYDAENPLGWVETTHTVTLREHA